MQCPACGHENPADSRFCVECAGDLLPVCASCGTANPAGAKFCKQCRSALTSAASLPSPVSAAPTPSQPLPTSFAGGRYAVRRFLGEGGRKRVYLAHDEKLDRDVAFAVIKVEGLDADGRTRVQREAQAMGRLGDHPNIVTVFDTGDEDAQPYIVSQYMAGGDLAAMLQAKDDHRLPIEQAVRITEQVCAGLEHAHARGIVHRDLKPGNIWFDSPGVAQIGDFGLAVALDRSRLTMAGMMVGTASYMPPEQAMGGETTPSSDLYALGCVLYEMVSGRPPFVGDDTVAVISQHVNTPPVAPTWHNAECPPALETLILRLLEKDAKKRPASAAQVREALVSFSSGPMAPAQPGAQPPQGDQANPIYRRTFVGREQEVKQLEKAFDGALSGRGALFMVVGEPGIGKTTITEQLSTYVGMRGGMSLVGHCYEEGSLSLPYLPFVEAMRSYVVKQDREQLTTQLGSGAGDVARIVSEVRDRVAVEPSATSSPEEERFRLFQAVASFLRNASGAQALCIVLEDLHDADKGTMEMLVHLARNLAGARILLVGTYRDVEVDRTHPLSAALAELRRVESFQRIPLRGLSPDEVQRMLSNIAGQEVLYVLAEAVYRQTEGNPLFVQEVIRYAAESGLIRREADQWVATTDSLITQIPEGLKDVIGRRLSGLSEDCNRVLTVASVIGRDFAVDVLQRVGGTSEEELLSALEEAMRVSLIEELKGGREARFRFTHAFFRQTLYEEMIAPRRLRMHNEVAKALEQHYAGRLEEHAAELAEHFSHSSTEEDLRKAIEYGKLAAARSAAVYAYGESARHLQQALEVQEVLDPKDGEGRLDLLGQLGTILLSAGESERVLKEVAVKAFELAESSGGGTRAARVAETATWALIYQHGSLAFVQPDYPTWCERIDAHAAPNSRERIVADLFMSWIHWFSKDQERCWELRRGALDMAQSLGDDEALALAVFHFLFDGGPQKWDRERLQVARKFRDIPRVGLPPNLTAQFLYSLVNNLMSGGDLASAEQYRLELERYAQRVDEPYLYMWQRITEAQYLLTIGEIEKSLTVAQELAAGAVARGTAGFGQLLSNYVAQISLEFMGRFEEMQPLPSVWSTLPYGEAIAARVYAFAGRRDEARREIRRIMTEQQVGEGDWIPDIALCNLLDAAVLIDDVESADLLYKRMAGAEDWYVRASYTTFARPMALAALLLGDAPAARSLLEKALVIGGAVGSRFDLARTHIGLARVLFEHYSDERAAATEHLAIATREAHAMKMKPLLDECLALKLKFQGITSTDVNTSIDTVARVVEAEKPDLRTHAAPDGTVTLMFSDIEDSTVLTERLGDQAWQDLLRKHNALIREQLQAHEGYEVKTMGDGFMVAFQSAKKGLECAIAIQRAFADHNSANGEHVKVRIGLHAGESIKDGDDFYGKNVILASRVAGKAVGGEILVSSLVRALVESSVEPGTFAEGREVELKGLAGSHTVYPVRLQ